MAQIEPDENIQALRQWSQSRTLGQTIGFLRLVCIGGEKKLQFVPTENIHTTHPTVAVTDLKGEFNPGDIVHFLEENYSHMPNEASIQEFYHVHRDKLSHGLGGSSSENITGNILPISHPLSSKAAEQLAVILLENLHCVNFQKELDYLQKKVPTNEFGEAVRLCFKNNMPIEQKMKLRTYLQHCFPRHVDFLFYRPDNIPVICSHGIEHILNYLRTKKNPVLRFPCRVCETPEFFLDLIRAIDPSTTLPQTFIVRCRRPETVDPNEGLSLHVTPFYVSRTPQGKIRLFWTDSVGGYSSMAFQLVSFMQSKPDIELFFCDIKRQMDDHSCAVFTIHDIIQANKNPSRVEALMDTAICTTPGYPLLASVKTVSRLPLPFMVTAQSYALIGEHLTKTEPTERLEHSQIEAKLRRFQRMGTTSRGEKKLQNAYVERRLEKYEGLIWQFIIASSQSK